MSKLHERRVRKLLKGRIVKGSGSGIIAKGDVKGSHVLVECKASLGKMPPAKTYLGKIAHEAKVLNRTATLSTARCEKTKVGDLFIDEILYFVPTRSEDYTVDLGAAMDPKVPRFWKRLTEMEYIEWLRAKNFLSTPKKP